jgi:hypothetical protein
MKHELTRQEKRAIDALKKLEQIWPKTLWLWSASGILYVMKTGLNGEQVVTSRGGVDRDYEIETIDIPNDGGDW